MRMSSVEVRTNLLKILDDLGKEEGEVIITKRGSPVAKLVPLMEKKPRFGLGAGLGETVGEIVDTDWSDDWESLQ